jgi:hypothetical protein
MKRYTFFSGLQIFNMDETDTRLGLCILTDREEIAQILKAHLRNTVTLELWMFWVILNKITRSIMSCYHTSSHFFSHRLWQWDGRAMAQAVSRRPLAAEGQVRAPFVPYGFEMDKVALGLVSLRVLRFSSVNVILPRLSRLTWRVNNRHGGGRRSEISTWTTWLRDVISFLFQTGL